MSAAVGRILASLAMSFGDDFIKLIVQVIAALLALVLAFLLCLPVLLVHIPPLTDSQIDSAFNAAEAVSDTTELEIPWEEVAAVWATLETKGNVHRLAENWAEKHEETKTWTDENGIKHKKTIIWYTLRDFDEVLAILSFTGEQKEQAARYKEAICEGGTRPPAGWRATPVPGWFWPVPGYDSAAAISSPYGLRRHPILRIPMKHKGVDISAPRGVPVFAARSGTVEVSSDPTGFGTYVIITGSGWKTTYGHLDRVSVSDGQQVEAGEYIGNVGSTGRSTGPHLHLQIEFLGTTQNPLIYF